MVLEVEAKKWFLSPDVVLDQDWKSLEDKHRFFFNPSSVHLICSGWSDDSEGGGDPSPRRSSVI